MDCARVVAHGRQLLGLVVFSICGVVDRFRRPYSDVAICATDQLTGTLPEHGRLDVVLGVDLPPAAVTSRWPSGETWQL